MPHVGHQFKGAVAHMQIPPAFHPGGHPFIPPGLPPVGKGQPHQMGRPQQNPVFQPEAGVIHVFLHHSLQQVKMQQMQLSPPALRGQGIQNKQIREGGGLFRIPVHHPGGPGVQVGQFKPSVAFPGIELPEPVELLPGHQQVHVVIPGNEALVAHRSQQRAAHQVIGDSVPVADRGNIPQLFQQLLMDFFQRQFLFHAKPPPPFQRWHPRSCRIFPADRPDSPPRW